MKSTIVYIVLFLSMFLYQPIMAQYSQGKENLIAPSPTVAALAKFGQIPVGYNTGVPKISIPLYTLKCGDLTLPISLDYHAGGIRVNDVASWVGLGWSLNAGGAINIAVQGRKDSYLRPGIIPIEDLETSDQPYTENDMNEFKNGADTEPDIYNYQLGSYAGQFIMDLRDGKVYNVNGLKDLTFDVTFSGSTVYPTAKDQFGAKYTFDYIHEQTSNTTQFYQYSFSTNSFTTYADGRIYGSTISTAIPLSKMVNANNTHSISFNYNRMYEDYYTQMNGSLGWGMSPSRTGWTEYKNPLLSYSQEHPNPENYSKTTKQCMTRKVSEILASNGIRIVLTAATTRNDLNHLSTSTEAEKGKSLDKIEIYDANNNLIKKWEFVYDYFTSYITNPNDNATNYRLKLVGLKEYGSTSASPQNYTFNYYGDAVGEPQLPYRNSFSGQDHWGYSNKLVTAADAQNFKKAFPNISNFYFTEYYRLNSQLTTASQSISYTEGESKEPNEAFISACSLKKITYPTGGSTLFEYESHVSNSGNSFDSDWTNRMGGGQRIKKITSNPLTGTPTVKEYLYTDESGNTTGEITNIPKPARQKVWQITGRETSGIIGSNIVGSSSISSVDQSYVELKSDCSSPLYTSIGSVLTYSSVTETDSEGKTIYNFYKRAENDGNVAFYEDFHNVLGVDRSPWAVNNFSLLTDDGEQIYFGTTYSHTRNYDLQTEDRGYWGTYYKHGTLKSKDVYNQTNQRVFLELYTYQDLNQKKITGLQVYQKRDIQTPYPPIWPGEPWRLLPTNFFNAYGILVGQCQLTGKSTTQYDVNGGNPITTTEEYTYNEDNLLVQTKSTNSSNDVITIINRYPSEINTGIYSVMKQRNMLNYPIETIKKKNNMLIGSELNTYQQVNGVSNFAMFLPEKVYRSKLVSPVSSFTPYDGTVLDPSYQSSPDLEYLSYNAGGKTCEIKWRNGITTSYLWSYGNQYPIAEIKNATYQDVKTALGYSDAQMLALNDNLNPNVTDISTLLGSYFAGRNALVSSYTYKPLVGITSQTDARGQTTTYEYDNFQRLWVVRDHNGKILKKYDYHYKP